MSMIEKNKSAEYYAGCRDAIWQYVVSGASRAWAMLQVNAFDDESPDGMKKRLQGAPEVSIVAKECTD